MTVRHHQFAAVSILLAGVVVLLAWGRSMGVDSSAIARDRDRFQGRWVATRIQAGNGLTMEGAKAATCRVEFAGNLAHFVGLIDQPEAEGTCYLEQQGDYNRVDFRLDAGWIIGIYAFEGDRLKLAINPFAPPERLGVPTRPRPRQLKPAEGTIYYEFRRDNP